MARITVEDCLDKESNRFSLVRLASRRAKQLLSGSSPVTDTKGNRAIVSALREIADGKVRFRVEDSEADALDLGFSDDFPLDLELGPKTATNPSPAVTESSDEDHAELEDEVGSNLSAEAEASQ